MKSLNLSNYALMLERKAYLAESVNLTEGKDDPDQQNETGLKNVLAGQTAGSAYTNQWEQLIADYNKNKATAGTYTVLIRHDNGQAMVNIEYGIGQDGKPVKGSIKLSQSTPQVTEVSVEEGFNTVKAASDAIKELFVEGSAFFAPYKGDWNDEDVQAANAFYDWYVSKWKAKIDPLVGTNIESNPGHSNSDIKLSANNIKQAVGSIVSKMKGDWDSNDSVVWNIVGADGKYTQYTVDTDF